LAARCQYFKKMFTSSFHESKTGATDFGEMSPSVLNNIVSCLYTGDATIDADNCIPLLLAAHQYEISRLTQLTIKVLICNLSVDNVLEVIRYAEVISNTWSNLHNFCVTYIGTHWTSFTDNQLNDSLKPREYNSAYQIYTNSLSTWNT